LRTLGACLPATRAADPFALIQAGGSGTRTRRFSLTSDLLGHGQTGKVSWEVFRASRVWAVSVGSTPVGGDEGLAGGGMLSSHLAMVDTARLAPMPLT
jgi:hypothetical protein